MVVITKLGKSACLLNAKMLEIVIIDATWAGIISFLPTTKRLMKHGVMKPKY
jgi:hypothetical protein